MQASLRIAVLRTDANVELAASITSTLEGISKEQVGRFNIKEFSCSGPESLIDILRRVRPDLSILIEPSERPFFAQLAERGGRSACGRSPFLLVLSEELARDAPRFLRAGAADFVVPPIRPWDLVPRVVSLLRPRESEDELVAHLKLVAGSKQIVGQSPLLLAQLRKLPRIAECDATVLISGETGTGKELCARAVHYLSHRASKPFVAVDCGAIPSELLENELFGHERGAYTTALTKQQGLIDEAAGGSLLLDEIDSLSMSLQIKLLRFLQEKEYRAVGSTVVRQADVRVIAASNISLEEAVRAGRFRQDLFYRLNVLSLVMPPLRDRREDVPLLAQHFLEKYADEFSRPARSLTQEAIGVLVNYPFPGNARELENLLERAVLACDGPLVDVRDLELPFLEPLGAKLLYQARKDLMVKSWERDELKRMLGMHRGNLSAIARAEGKDASAFRALLRKYHLRPDRASPYWDIRA
ncbi:MAG TPA: sigma-54 dependent transcriptional regulator [Verrucomicrobiae bacterium]